MVKIYTRSGDQGETSLLGGERVSKSDPRVEAYGTVDELNSVLGLARAKVTWEELARYLEAVQAALFQVGAELAMARPEDPKLVAHIPQLTAAQVEELEAWIDRLDEHLPPLRNFILPGGSEVGALFHLARAVCRRAERRVVALAQQQPVNPEILRFLNRLGDFLFVAARWVNKVAGTPEPVWRPGSAPRA